VDLRGFSVDFAWILCLFSVGPLSILCRSSVDSLSVLCRFSVRVRATFLGSWPPVACISSFSVFGVSAIGLATLEVIFGTFVPECRSS
jgi:hypothetical protein